MKPEEQDSLTSGFIPPTTLGKAYSLIQRWYLTESSGGPMNENIFDYDHFTAFVRCGVHSAWLDTIIWTFVYIVLGSVAYFIQENYLVEKTTDLLIWKVNGSLLYILVKVGSFSSIAFHTGLFFRMSRLYIGVVCKKAIRTLCWSRVSFLFAFSVILFAGMSIIYRALTDQRMYEVASWVASISPDYGDRVNVFLISFFKPYCFQSALICFITSVVSTLVIYLPIIFTRFRKQTRTTAGPSKGPR